jgi:predicted unusual protein kinase regulating ubiquinone biosynthesis (AarF/ABC1/UbiB family)
MRTLAILRALLPLVLSLLRDRRRWLVAGPPAAREEAFHRRRARRLVEALTGLGPTFIKLGQVFGGRSDLLPDVYVHELATLTDRVAPIPFAQVAEVIAASYGRPVDELFERFEREPLAAASLGQVHRARARGREVAVKVLRPGVERLVADDLRAARRILDWVARRFPGPHVSGLRGAVEEFAARVHEELDFRLEAAHAAEIRRHFAGNRWIRVPEVLDEFTRQRVVVLEYLEGRRIDRLEPLLTSGRLRAEQVVSRVVELYLQMMLVDGLFHADPHPGNLLVADDGTLILLDFGMVVRVSRERRRQILDVALAAIRREADGVVAGFYALGLVEPGADRGAIHHMAEMLLALAARRTTTQERLQYLSEQVLTTLYDWPVVLPGDLVYFARTAALIEGLGIRYDARFNALAVATPLLLRLSPRILAALDGDSPQAGDWASALGTFLGLATRVLRRAGEELGAMVRSSRVA